MYFNIMNFINIFIIVILSLYIIINIKLPNNIMKIITNDIAKIIILFIMIITNNPTISILIFMTYVIIIIQYKSQESFSCLYNRKKNLKCMNGTEIIYTRGQNPYCGIKHKD